MWFKQVTPFRLPELPEKRFLDESLGNSWFTEPQGLDWFSEGFTHPNAFTDLAVFEAQKTMLISLMREEKVIPRAAVNHKLDEQVVKIQTAEGRNVGRREKQELREAIIDDLLPKALIKSSRTYGLFSGEWLFVDTANRRKAENLLIKLREALGGLPAQHLVTRQSPSALMTNWLLQGEAQGRFMLDFDVTLVGAGDVAPKVKISRKDLTAEDVVQHAKNGMKVTELGLVWNDRVAFILTQDLTLKRIQWLDVVQEEASGSCDDAESMAYATQLLMEAALSAILGELVDLLEGWQE
jgi:recombination-associated protein rdgC|nr:MAG TPA: putative exonuclease [Caudoviricetes sp.]